MWAGVELGQLRNEESVRALRREWLTLLTLGWRACVGG